MIIPGFCLWFVDGFAICLLLGAFCARFRDVPPIVGSVMQIAFFVTPIMWPPSILAHRGLGIVLVKWNPFYVLLEIIRGPLLATPSHSGIWVIALAYSAVLVIFSGFMFALARARIAYWV